MNETTTKIFPYLERLLDGEEVEWKTLGEVCDILRGKRVTKKELSDEGEYAVFQNSMIPLGYYHQCNVSGDTTFVICAGSAGEIGYSKEDFWAADDVYYFACSDCLISKYVYYFLYTKQLQILQQVRKAIIPRLSKKTLENLPIPVPPLRVQARIVEILDKFTQLEAELEAELEARRKQYAYYRDQLLNLSQYPPPLNVNIEWRTLGEVCLVQRGASPRPIANYLTNSPNGVPWIKIGDTKVGSKYIESTQERITIEGAQRSRQLSAGDFILSNSMSYGRPYILKIDGAIHDGWASLSEISSSILSDYLFYFLSSSKVQMYWDGKINSGSVSNLNADIIKALPIPIPPLSEQRRIVDILDRFDTLTNSISEGLPKEIALRRKQYAYYRDALLSFPRPEVSA